MTRFKTFMKSRAGMLLTLFVLIFIVGAIWFTLDLSGKNRIITVLEIKITPDKETSFVNQQDISNIITKAVGNPMGRSANEVNLTRIEAALKKLPFLQSAQAFVGIDGKLKVNVTLRIPILRVTNLLGETYYLDSNGYKIPNKGTVAPNVIVANGNITEKLSDTGKARTPALKDLLNIAKFIAADSFWDAQCEQCYVDNFGDVILVPRVGRHSIVIGSSENLPEKFENLRIFYVKGLKNLGWEKYKTIDLRYHGQVVGIKSGKETEQKKPKNVQKPQH